MTLTQLQNFSEVGSRDEGWWPDLTWPGAKILRQCVEKMNEQLYQARRRCAPPFLRYLQKTWGGGAEITPPGCARVKVIEVTRGHQQFFANNLRSQWVARGIGVIAFVSARRIEWCIVWPTWVTEWPCPDLTWGQIQIIALPSLLYLSKSLLYL